VGGALSGIRVVELATGVAGPMAAMLLADFGADVVKVEPPSGTDDRLRPGFAMWGRGKSSVLQDPASRSGRDELQWLLDRADVCIASPDVTSQWPGTMAEQATARNPGLVYLSMPPYLDSAPWAGGRESNGLLSAAMGGSLRQSSGDGGPVDPVYPHLLYMQAIWAACCAVAALFERQGSGLGQVVTVGGVHGAMAASPLQMVVRPGQPDVNTAVGPGGPSPAYTRYRCADGRWLLLAALTPKFQSIALQVLGFSDLLEKAATSGFAAVIGPAQRARVRPRFEAAFAARTSEDWLAAFRAAGCPVALLAGRESWLDHPQIRAIGMAVTVTDPDGGIVTMPGNPVVLSATPALSPRPAPQLGSPGAALPEWPAQPAPGNAAPPAADNAGRRAPGSAGQRAAAGPLAGTRVLDVGVILAGPYCGTLLAELGADVVKVEIPDGDSFRLQGFPYIRGQRGLAIDLRAEKGRAVFRELVRSADVVIDNYRPGVAERLGVSYERLRQEKPDIISMSVTAFGESGPLRDEAGFDTILQAMSGIMTAQGGNGEPVLLTLAVNDTAAAALTALGACLALFHRARTGAGQRGSACLAAASVLMQCEELIRVNGRPAPVRGGPDFRGSSSADRFYRTCDGWIRVQATSERPASAAALAGLARLAGCACPDVTSGLDDALAAALESRFAGMSTDEALAQLAAAQIPALRARRGSELPDDPQLIRWQVHQRMSSGQGAELHAAGRMARFSRTQRNDVLVPPGVGEHTVEILLEAGMGEEEIGSLIKNGVVRAGDSMIIAAMTPYR
jgi:crotonobetainyl-CoA:carnitine CoA-transferase CaiB-like acyl-CoA transferase